MTKKIITNIAQVSRGQNPLPISIETFREIGSYEFGNIGQKEPSCFNEIIRILKHRVTVEVIVEPMEVYHERLQKLWDEADNIRNADVIKETTKLFGYELRGGVGNKRKVRK